MDEMLKHKLEELGLIFGYPDDEGSRAPLDVDTDAVFLSVLQSVTEAGATLETLDDVFEAGRDGYAAQASAVVETHSVGG